MTAVAFVVHSRAHLDAALTAAREFGRPVIAISGEGASAYAGPGWFLALIRQARAEFPDVELTAILDCADRAGDALAALKEGAEHLIFTGHPDAAARLAAIAGQTGATISHRRPDARDLMGVKDVDYAAREWCYFGDSLLNFSIEPGCGSV
jgi:hypothetical protein